MLPNLQGPNERIEFLIIDRVIQLGSGEFFTKVSYRPSIVHEHTSNTRASSVTMNLKGFIKIG